MEYTNEIENATYEIIDAEECSDIATLPTQEVTVRPRNNNVQAQSPFDSPEGKTILKAFNELLNSNKEERKIRHEAVKSSSANSEAVLKREGSFFEMCEKEQNREGISEERRVELMKMMADSNARSYQESASNRDLLDKSTQEPSKHVPGWVWWAISGVAIVFGGGGFLLGRQTRS